MIHKPLHHTRMRCPRCFCEDLREGEGFPGPDDEDEVQSFEIDILQCMGCGWSGDESRFKPPANGIAVISPWTEIRLETISDKSYLVSVCTRDVASRQYKGG